MHCALEHDRMQDLTPAFLDTGLPVIARLVTSLVGL
jgi:hypothetical protein